MKIYFKLNKIDEFLGIYIKLLNGINRGRTALVGENADEDSC